MGTRFRATAVAVATLMALGACGGGSDDSAATTTSGSDESTTTTLGGSSVTDAATLTAADMGGEWADYEEEAKGTTGGEATCGTSDATKAFDTVVAAGDGAILQRGDLERYVQTSTWEFATPEDAVAFVTSRLADDWIECVRSSTEAGLAKEPVQTVKTYGVTRDRDGDFAGHYGLEFDEAVDGKQTFTGAYAFHNLYQKGTVVIDDFYQVIARSTDAEDLNKTVDAEVDAGMAKVLARVPAPAT